MYSYHIGEHGTMMAKPIRAVKLHYPMIQFLIKFVILVLELYSGIVQMKKFASMSTRLFVVFNSIFWPVCKCFLPSSWEKVYRSRLYHSKRF